MVGPGIDPSLAAQIGAMKTAVWLAQLPKPLVQRLVEEAIIVSFAPGQNLYEPEDPPGGIYGIIEGAVRVRIATSEASSQLIGCFQKGAWIGQAPSISGTPRTMGFNAVNDVRALHLPLSTIGALVQETPGMGAALATLSEWNLNLALQAIGELTIPKVERRIAARLLGMANYPFGLPNDGIWEVPLNQSEIAEIATCSRHNVNRVIGDFRKNGWVGAGHKPLVILDPEAIRAFAERD